MSSKLPPMVSDPSESELVRELLQAAKDAPIAYDVEAGLARHQGHIAAGTPAPDWAGELAGSAATSAAGTKLGLSAALGWAIATAMGIGAVTAGVMLGSDAEPAPTVVPSVVVPSIEVGLGEGSAEKVPVTAETQVAEVAEVAEVAGEAEASAKRPDAVQPVRRPNRQARRPMARKARGPRTERAGGSAAVASDQGIDGASARTAQVPVVGDAPGRSGASDDAVNAIVEASEARRRAEREALEARSAEAARAVDSSADDAHERWSRGAMSQEKAPDPGALLAREMRMLKAAQAALGSNPGRALLLAQQGEREFPDSTFSQERQHVRILALVEVGRVDEAKRHAAGYLKRYPRGPFSDRVRKALAAHR